MEFEVKSDLTLLQPQKIESNVAEVKSWLQNALEPYKNMVVSEDSVKAAKEDRAKINKLKTAIDEKRKSTKKMWVSPYVQWENEVNELISMCDEASKNIDGQIKNFEDAIKQQKRDELESFFNEQASAADVDFYITFEQIFNPKWLNNTVKIDTAKEEIEKAVEDTVDDLKMIADLESDYSEELFLIYKETHDIKSVIARNKALTAFRNSDKARASGEDAWKAAENIKLPWGDEPPQTAPKTPQKEPEKLYDLLLQLKLTENQARNLKKYMATEGIEVVQSKMKERKS